MSDKKKNSHLIIGRKPVTDAINARTELEKVWIDRSLKGPVEKEVRNKCKEYDIPLSKVHAHKLNKISKANHQGLVAQVSLIKYQRVDDVVQHLYNQGEMPFFVILDGVTDVRNLGAIARSAEIFGINALITPLKSTAIINDFSMKSSAGALEKLTVCRVNSVVNTIEELQKMGLKVYAADMQGETELKDLTGNCPLAIVVGDEETGVNPATLRTVDKTYYIPQKGLTESLNVSVAAAISFYEMMKKLKYIL